VAGYAVDKDLGRLDFFLLLSEWDGNMYNVSCLHASVGVISSAPRCLLIFNTNCAISCWYIW